MLPAIRCLNLGAEIKAIGVAGDRKDPLFRSVIGKAGATLRDANTTLGCLGSGTPLCF
jgi:hypothetical protein